MELGKWTTKMALNSQVNFQMIDLMDLEEKYIQIKKNRLVYLIINNI